MSILAAFLKNSSIRVKIFSWETTRLKSRMYVSQYVYNYLVLHILFIIIITTKTHSSVSCGSRKRGMRKQSEYIHRNNKVTIFTHLLFRDAWSKWHQIYGGVGLHSGEARFQILIRSLKPFPRYESAKFRKISSFFFFLFFFFFFSHTLRKSL